MIKISATIFCDNDACPDEAQADTLITLKVESWSRTQGFYGVASELTDDGLELPSGWVKYEGKTYCSDRCSRESK